ncbi:MAG: hypothetical protein JOY51_05585 [Nevskia sp.]|nr:hypothetical protein [Nevskia sp.]
MITFEELGDELTVRAVQDDKVSLAIASERLGGSSYASFLLNAEQVERLIGFLQDWQRQRGGRATG